MNETIIEHKNCEGGSSSSSSNGRGSIKLSQEQENALQLFEKGKNIFLTGPGGSGKTELIKRFVDIANKQFKRIQVCALTGCAAVLLGCPGSKTIHSWAGIGIASAPFGSVVDRVVKNRFKSKAWNSVDVLVIDEVSMMSKKIFEILDSIGRRTRHNPTKPFGGIQIVLSGDFYQLPPVGDRDDEDTSAFCFESDKWKEIFTKENVVQLKTIFRQTDTNYTKILNQIRVGKLYKSSYELVMKRVGVKYPENGIKPTILLPRRRDVEQINTSELEKLTGEVFTYNLSIVNDVVPSKKKKKSGVNGCGSGSDNDDIKTEIEISQLRASIIADDKLVLKVGTQVMCIANIDVDGALPIVNGSQGVVVEMVNGFPKVKFLNGLVKVFGYHSWTTENVEGISIKQIPLIHSWAITIHKAQGVTLELAEIDAGSNIFECGQTYVALSRVKSLDGLYLSAFNPQKIKVNEKVQKFYA
jgi:ATP-dependent DNA helicase PIF1